MEQHVGKKGGVVLSGCGVYDGAEIHETVIKIDSMKRLFLIILIFLCGFIFLPQFTFAQEKNIEVKKGEMINSFRF